jgi:Flp pilus assembly protein TadG
VDRCFRRKMASRERGAEAVEFALVVPIFLLLVFGVVDFGWMINNDTMVNNASREGARVGALDPVTADIQATVLQDSGTLDTTQITTTVTCLNPPVPPASTGTSCASMANATSGGTVIVKVAYQHSWITPVGSTLMPSGIKLTKTTQMRIE